MRKTFGGGFILKNNNRDFDGLYSPTSAEYNPSINEYKKEQKPKSR